MALPTECQEVIRTATYLQDVESAGHGGSWSNIFVECVLLPLHSFTICILQMSREDFCDCLGPCSTEADAS